MSSLPYHQKNVWERTSKIGPVDVVTLLFGNVDFLTFRTVYFHPGSPDFLAHTDWKGRLAIAEHPRAHPKSSLAELLFHYGQSFWGDYVSGVDKSIDVGCLLIDGEVSM